jgi:hypothetical protein
MYKSSQTASFLRIEIRSVNIKNFSQKVSFYNSKEGPMKSLLFRATAPAVTLASCLCMFGGVASAQSASITDSGRDSTNEISFKNLCVLKVNNDTDVTLTNTNSQNATSGNSNVNNNDDVGNVTTGSASNSNSSSFNVSVTNTTGSCVPGERPETPGQGGGTTTPVTQASTPVSSSVAPAGGRGADVASVPVAQQVAVVPKGGVGAGGGSQAYLAGLTAITMASSAWVAQRLQRSFKVRV